MSVDQPGRPLGLWSSVALVVANMIGAGVFTTSGYALADLGERQFVMYAWAMGGVLAFCGALSYAALLRQMPMSGGEYHYLSRTVHPMAGFLAGWVSLLAGFTAPIALAALALSAYLGPVVGFETDESVAGSGLASGVILLAFAMHILRRHRGVVLQNVAVLLKLLLLVGFLVVAVVELPNVGSTQPAPAPSPSPVGPFDAGAFAVTLVWISLAYSGWNATVYVAGEVADARRNATRSLLVGCGAVIVVYLSLNYVFLYAVPVSALAGQKDVAAIAAEALGGPGFATFVRGIVVIALFTSVSSMMMAGPRVYARMAADGLFPRVFRLEGEVPFAALALQAVCAVAVVWWAKLSELLGYIGFTLGLSSATAVVGLMVLRWRLGGKAVPVVGYPVVPLLYVGMTLWAVGYMFARRPTEAMWGGLTVLIGVPVYLVFAARATGAGSGGERDRRT